MADQKEERKEFTLDDAINNLRKIRNDVGQNLPIRITEPAGYLKEVQGLALRKIQSDENDPEILVVVIE